MPSGRGIDSACAASGAVNVDSSATARIQARAHDFWTVGLIYTRWLSRRFMHRHWRMVDGLTAAALPPPIPDAAACSGVRSPAHHRRRRLPIRRHRSSGNTILRKTREPVPSPIRGALPRKSPAAAIFETGLWQCVRRAAMRVVLWHSTVPTTAARLLTCHRRLCGTGVALTRQAPH